MDMLVAVSDQAEARRLQLDGYSRTGNKAVEAKLDDLDSILERDDVRVKKISLARSNSDSEAAVIDREIQQHSGRVDQEYAQRPYSATSSDPIRRQTQRLFNVDEDSISIYRDFRDVIDGEYQLRSTTDEDLEDLKQSCVDELESNISDLEDQVAYIESLSLGDVLED